ncbi:MAG: hypothetical protein ACTSRG_01800 [Candidatus Helarchaeota archaeon]
MKRRNVFLFIAALLVSLTLSGTLITKPQMKLFQLPQISETTKTILDISAAIENETGECESGIYNMYMFENSSYDLINSTDRRTVMYAANRSYPSLDFGNLTTSKVSLMVTGMTKQFRNTSVASNATNAINSTEQNKCYRLAQNFTLNETSHVYAFMVYINYSCAGPLIPGIGGVLYANIYRNGELNGTRVNQFDMATGLANTSGNWIATWAPISYNGLLLKGNYYFEIYTLSLSLILAPNNNSWQIQNYTNPSDDKGDSLVMNSSGDWNPIPDDGHADFLLNITSAPYVSPYEANLTGYFEGEKIDFTHYQEPNPSYNKYPWVSYEEIFLPNVSQHPLNFTMKTNITLGFGGIVSKLRFVKILPANGSYFADMDNRYWAVNYTSINATSDMSPIYLFPSDWTVDSFYNRYGDKVTEYGIMYSRIYNKSYSGIYYPETGDGQSMYNYSCVFLSHNYISEIKPQVYSGTNFYDQLTFFEGDRMRIQVEIKDFSSNYVSGGNCTILVYDPLGNLIYVNSTIPINGIADSSAGSTSGWAIGTYTVIVFWTNGYEIGFSQKSFALQENPIPIIPPPMVQEPIWLYIAITALVVAMIGVGGVLIKRKMLERNWEKSLLHLFIMTKDGRSLYNYEFGIEAKDPTLISGMLTALTSFVQETVGSKKGLKTIDQEDKKVILAHGGDCTVAIFAEKDLPIIHRKTSEFLKSFETYYAGKIAKWDGASTTFKSAGELVEKYFPVSVEDKIIRGVGSKLKEIHQNIISATNPQEIFGLLQQVTQLAEQYKEIIREHFNKQYGEIIKIANEKIQN